MAKKKYTLFKSDGNSGPAQCAFFNSPEGCKNGDNCKFLHVSLNNNTNNNNNNTNDDLASTTSSSVVSSESEDEMDLSMILPKDAKCKMAPKSENGKKKKKRKRDTDATVPNDVSCDDDDDDELDIFKLPTRAANKVPDGKKRPTAAETKVQTPTKKSRTPAKKKKKTSSPTPAAPQQPSFRSLNLPIAEFSCYDGQTKNNDKNNENSSPPIKQEETETKPKIPTPKSTPEGLKWQAACLQTRSHEKYASAFDFPKYQRLDSENGRGPPSAWITARPYGEWCASNPHAVAIDCEMCETRCPENGNTNPKALCRLSVVNAVDPREVLIDTLVKPDWPVVDYRSRINGIKKENLDEVKFTLKHAQAFMLALCSEETVIIGHAVHNDLVALKFQHHCNVDSAFLFTLKDEPESTCSLKDLAMTVLKKEMPETHDSVNDARTAMQCIDEGYLQTNGRPEPIVRTFTPKSAGASNLLVHRIPKVCKREHIEKMFLSYTSIMPSNVPDVEFNGESGKVMVSFTSPAHANLAFGTISGEGKPDKTGRLQKRIYLKGGGYVQVRLMKLTKGQRENGQGPQSQQQQQQQTKKE